MGVATDGTEAVESLYAERGRDVAVGSTADSNAREIAETDVAGDCAGPFEQLRARGPLQRQPHRVRHDLHGGTGQLW